MRKNSVKNRKINDEVRRVLAQIISGGIKDPRVSPMTSVLAVEVAPDLKTCKVWVSVYGDDQKKKDTMEGLNSASGFIRGELRPQSQSPQHSAAPVHPGRLHRLRRRNEPPHR